MVEIHHETLIVAQSMEGLFSRGGEGALFLTVFTVRILYALNIQF